MKNSHDDAKLNSLMGKNVRVTFLKVHSQLESLNAILMGNTESITGDFVRAISRK